MQNFRSVVGQFRCLRVRDLVEHAGIRHGARIAAHNSVDVGPDPQLGRIQHCREDGCREVGATAAESGRTAVHRRAIKPGDDGNDALVEKRPDHGLGPLARLLEQRRGIAEHGIGHDDVKGVNGPCLHTVGVEVFRHQERRQAFADGESFIHRSGRPLAQHADAVRDAAKVGQ